MKYIVFFLLILFSYSTWSVESCLDQYRLLPIENEGRVRPLFSIIKELDDSISIVNQQFSSRETFCRLVVYSSPDEVFKSTSLKVRNYYLRELFQLQRAQKALPLSKVFEERERLNILLESSTLEGHQRFQIDNLLKVLSLLNTLLSDQLFNVFRDGKFIRFERGVELGDSIRSYQNDYGKSYLVEYYYDRVNLVLISLLLGLLTVVLILNTKKLFWPFLSLTILSETSILVLRWIISGRPPLSNMYETVMFFGYASLLIGVIFYRFYRNRGVLFISQLLNLLVLLLLVLGNQMFDATIKPLVPVLRNDFWLTIHVVTIMIAYAALGFAWLSGNISLLIDLIKEKKKNLINIDEKIILKLVQIGSFFLGLGILTGAIWADFAWGRFWGWDPKETWSLITLLIYMIILHGRYTSWISSKFFVPLAVLAFLSVMMAWFGVNYVLGTGLHSYGFSTGGALFFILFVIIQLIFSGFHYLRFSNKTKVSK